MNKKRKRNFGNIGSYYKNGRLNLIIAILFLLGGLVLYKLYDLQIKNHDYYIAMARGQHQISSILKSERGTIYINKYDENGNVSLFPFATNKDFASVFAIPKDVKNPEDIAEKLYKIFKEQEVVSEVEKIFEEQEAQKLKEELDYVDILDIIKEEKETKKNEVLNRYESKKYDKEHLEYVKIKKEAEIEIRKEIVIEDYLKILKKRNDPYEPIEKKVDEEKLLKLYALMLSDGNSSFSGEEFEIKNGRVVKKDNPEEFITIEGISYNMVEYRFYPEGNIGSHILGFVNIRDDGQRGNYGLEGFFDEELFGEYGNIESERGATSNVIIINDREFTSPVNGKDIVLTIDQTIQYNVCNKLNKAVSRHGADGGSVIIMNPETGEIITMCSAPDYDPNNYDDVADIQVFNNPAIFSEYEPGSVFKTITMAAALDQGKITPETKYIDEGQIMVSGWPKPIKNSDYSTFGAHGEVSMNTVLELSLNTGAIFAMKEIGYKKFAEYVINFGFGEKTGLEMETETKGDIRNLTSENIKEVDAAVASFGQGIAVSPLQMVNSFAAIANGGILMKPYIVKEIINPDGTKEVTKPRQIRRVISEKAAVILSGMLVNVVESGHAAKAAVTGYYVGGKTGTAQVASASQRGYGNKTNHTFIGFAPIEQAKYVMLVKLDNPKDVQYSASSAAPLFGEISEFLLQYWQIPKER